tara:strand:- start:93 stop:698 length:606 start_codon:yes stop_codon:yes gene_type:complete
MIKLGILDYGTGNLENIKNVLSYLNVKFKIINSSSDFKYVEKLILPGVGNFDFVMREIIRKKMKKKIIQIHKGDGMIFGICLGMQILLDRSKESKNMSGLKILNGKVTSINDNSKIIPNFGWYRIKEKSNNKIFRNIHQKSYYFAHSYHCIFKEKYNLNYIKYKNKNIIASVENKNIFGCQFHPELSGHDGIAIYQRFINI